MLVLSRRLGEKIVLNNGITLTVTQCKNGRVRLGIEAPPHVPILRGELAGTPPPSTPPNPSDMAERCLTRWRQQSLPVESHSNGWMAPLID